LRLKLIIAAVILTVSPAAIAQAPANTPVAVGVVRAELQPITETNQFNGRIEATDRVNVVARVIGFLEDRSFTEGTEVKKGDLLYRIEQAPYQADVAAKKAAIQQLQAQLENANITLNRAETLLHTPAGQQSTVDTARANQLSLKAQIAGAQAQLRQSEINLGYTEIHSPIDGKISQTAITVGNVVGPTSGTLATIVSQDPMYVTFPIPVTTAIELRQRYAPKGGFRAVVIRLKLPDGRMYGQTGTLNFVNNTVTPNTDTLLARASIPNPLLPSSKQAHLSIRELLDGEFVVVILEGVVPVQALTIPRSAVLADQKGYYVYVVGADNHAEQQRIQLGQSTPSTATVIAGLNEGQLVIVEGIQRVHPGQPVIPGPAATLPSQAAAQQ
jgi:membrane fusion protein (multidrug efflux system)